MSGDYGAVALLIVAAIGLSIPVGGYVALVFTGRPTWLDRVVGPLESLILRLSGVDVTRGQDWRQYATSLLVSNAVMWLAALAMFTAQGHLPFNPDAIPGMEPTLAFNTASSFTTNTNLQHYSGETGLSLLSQMVAVTFLQFMTAATGMAVAMAVMRGLAGDRLTTLGNFHVDLVRSAVRVLLPLSFVVALVLLGQGTPMTFDGSVSASTLEGGEQRIARGVVASMVAIKQLGTNGGGYFGANSAHPFENPTALSNAVESISILLLPMATIWALGHVVRRRRVALMVFAVMLALYIPLLAVAVTQEAGGHPAMARLGVDESSGAMEGKEVRIGSVLTAFWAVSTTATSNGSVNGMLDSLTPLGGLAAMAGLWLNCIFGGVGVGFVNMFVFIVIAVFVAGMMIGRTPEFLGKRVEAKEMKLASLALLWHPLAILVGTAIACWAWSTTAQPGDTLAWLRNPGPHGFSEMLYEFSSAAANNGSGFEGLGDNTPFWNITTGVSMVLSRYVPIIAPLALAGSLAAKPTVPDSAGTLQAGSLTFGVMLWAVVVVLDLLMFLPVAVLGPIAEFLALPTGS